MPPDAENERGQPRKSGIGGRLGDRTATTTAITQISDNF